jgi:hypothetical protein
MKEYEREREEKRGFFFGTIAQEKEKERRTIFSHELILKQSFFDFV